MSGLFSRLRRRVLIQFKRDDLRLRLLQKPLNPEVPRWLQRRQYEMTLEFAKRTGHGAGSRHKVIAKLPYLQLPEVLKLIKDATDFLTGKTEEELGAIAARIYERSSL